MPRRFVGIRSGILGNSNSAFNLRPILSLTLDQPTVPNFPSSTFAPSTDELCLSTTFSSFFFFFFSLLINTDRITVDTYYLCDGAIYSALRLNLFAFEECQRRGIIENEEIVWNGKERIFYIRAHNGVWFHFRRVESWPATGGSYITVEVDAFFTREGRITGLCIAMNKRVAQAW